MTQKLYERGPGTAHDFILRGVYERIETTVEEGDNDEHRPSCHVLAYHAHCGQHHVYLVRHVIRQLLILY